MSTVEITNIEYDKENLSFILSGDVESWFR